jgi:hypothetical protein
MHGRSKITFACFLVAADLVIATPLTPLPFCCLPSPSPGAASQRVSRLRRALLRRPRRRLGGGGGVRGLGGGGWRLVGRRGRAPLLLLVLFPRAFLRRRSCLQRRSHLSLSAVSPCPRSSRVTAREPAAPRVCVNLVSSSTPRIASPLTPRSFCRLHAPLFGAASQEVSRPRRAPCLVRFFVAAPDRIAAHALPPPYPFTPSRRHVAGSEPAPPRAVSCAFPRRRSLLHCHSCLSLSAASPRPRSAPCRSW